MRGQKVVPYILTSAAVMGFFYIIFITGLPQRWDIPPSLSSLELPFVHANACQYVNNTYFRNNIDLRIIVITYNRADSLLRLLNSLQNAHYFGDRVVIEIWLDRSKYGWFSMRTVSIARQFVFVSGKCDIYVHDNHVGIRGQWLDTWKNYQDEKEIAVILEDDITVSPFFYKWLKLTRKQYGHMKEVNGFSLQGWTIRHSDGDCCVKVPKKYNVFLYPTLGTTGFSPNNKQWKAFKDWFSKLKSETTEIPVVPNHVASKWYKTEKDSMWEMEYLYFTWKQHQYTLYPNFEDNKGLSFNWLEDGLHYSGQAVDLEAANKGLVMTWKTEYGKLPRIPVVVNNSGEILRTMMMIDFT